MATEADESPVAEEQEQVEDVEQTVELDRTPDVEGELIPNPVLEETDEETEDADAEDEVEETTESEETAEETPPAQDAVEETPVVERPAEDPGEFKPKNDYSFEVTTTDGKTVKITTPEEADKFVEQLDENPELISASQFTKFNRAVSKMDNGLDSELREYNANKEQFETQQASEAERTQQVQTWSNELKYLETKGMIPKIDSAKDADWLGNAEDEAVKARMGIINWMETENKARDASGIGRVTSMVDAFRMMQAEQAETNAQTERTQEADKRRAKGSRVAGNAPHMPSNTPKNTIIGAGGSLKDLIYEAQMAQQ